jgi:hypothetical protein
MCKLKKLGNFSPKLLFVADFSAELRIFWNFSDLNGIFAHFGAKFSQFWQKTRQ